MHNFVCVCTVHIFHVRFEESLCAAKWSLPEHTWGLRDLCGRTGGSRESSCEAQKGLSLWLILVLALCSQF